MALDVGRGLVRPVLPLTPPDSSSHLLKQGLVGPPGSAEPWHFIAAKKQEEREQLLCRNARIPHLAADVRNVSALRAQVLEPLELEITSLSASELARRIAARTYTSVQVIIAYIRAATIAQDATNCLTEICFEQGILRAQELDQHLAQTGKTIGPLHGVPVSIKDHVDVAGTDSASGFIAWCYQKVASKDSVIVTCLKLAGAVIYCKTSNPQSLLAIETNNNVFGRTTNPFNRSLSAGGSSGGEGALIAQRGSPLGVGTDIAGSIRIPALWNGLYGLRPSIGRLPHTGLQGPSDGMDAIMGAVGPLASSLEDIELFCASVLSPLIQPWHLEAQVINKAWSKPSLDPARKLVVAVMKDDGVVAPHPPIAAALAEAVVQLKAQGHIVVEWTPVHTQQCDDMLFSLILQDQGDEYWDLLASSGEPPVPGIEWLLREKASNRIDNPYQLWELTRQRERVRQDAVEQWTGLEQLLSLQVDAILCPGAPTLAPRHDKSRHWMYTAVWNVLDWPAITFPVKSVNTAQVDWPPHLPRSILEAEVMAEWNEAWYTDAPVGLQLVGRRLEEEKLLADLGVLEMALHH